MKKKAFIATIACVLYLAACSNQPAVTTTTTTAATTEAATTTAAATTIATEETTTAATTTAEEATEEIVTTAEPDGNTYPAPTLVGLDGFEVDKTLAASASEYYANFDFAYLRMSTGFYEDSTTNADKFDLANYLYNGTQIKINPSDWQKVKVGDSLGGMYVTFASTNFQQVNIADGDLTRETCHLLGNFVELSGEHELYGYMWCYMDESEAYTATGDLFFCVNPTLSPDFPIAAFSVWGDGNTAPFNAMFARDGSFGVMSDSVVMGAGNIYGEEEGRIAGLRELGKNETGMFPVKITIDRATLDYSDSFGNLKTAVHITSVEKM